MATNKLIKPTNVTVSIPAFTDQPDQRVNSNCIDKSIDGINALSDQIANLIVYVQTSSAVTKNGGTSTISYPTGYSMDNCVPVYAFLFVNASGARYVDGNAVVNYFHTDGIHVTNNGGADGYIFVGLAKLVAAT